MPKDLRTQLAKRRSHYEDLITAIDLLVAELNVDEPKLVKPVITRPSLQHNLSTLQELLPTDSVSHIGKRLIPALLHYLNFDDPQEWPLRTFSAEDMRRTFKERGLHINLIQAANVCNSLYYRKIIRSTRKAGGRGRHAIYTVNPKSEWKTS